MTTRLLKFISQQCTKCFDGFSTWHYVAEWSDGNVREVTFIEAWKRVDNGSIEMTETPPLELWNVINGDEK